MKEGLIVLVVGLVLLMTASGQMESVDGTLSLEMARNWVNQGQFQPSNPKYGIGGAVVDDGRGNYSSSASRGYAATLVPAAWIAKQVYVKSGVKVPTHFPLESDYLLSLLGSMVNPLLGVILFLLNWSILTSLAKSKRIGLMAAVIISLATNLWPLSKHGFANFLVVVEMVTLFWVVINYEASKKWYWWIGGLLIVGLLWWSYNLSVVLVYLMIGYIVFDRKYWGKKMEKKDILFLTTLGLVVGVGILAAVEKTGGIVWIKNMLSGEGGSRDWFQAIWGMLLSPGRSLMVYSPIWGLAMITALLSWKSSRWSRLLIVGTVAYVGFYSLFDIWSGELSWGPRYLSPLIPVAGFVLADSWQRLNKKWLTVLMVVGVYVQLVGVTVPYETQYQGMSVGNFSEGTIASRQNQFDYWSLGEFLPKYSPVYRLKKNLIHRWLLITKVFSKRPEIVFGGGATLPIDGYRFLGSDFKLVPDKPIGFSTVSMKFNNFPKTNVYLMVCINDWCQEVKGKLMGNEYLFSFKKNILVNSQQSINLKLISSNDQRYLLTKLVLGENVVDMNSYKLLLADKLFDKALVTTDDREVLYQRYYDRKSVANMTADFWWVRNAIYFDQPDYRMIILVVGVGTVGGLGLLWLFLTGRRKMTRTYDYYHKNTFWNDHYLVRKYMNRLATGNEDVDWLNFVFQKYFKNKKPIKVMSVGCGNGWQDRLINEIFKLEELDGYDIADDLLSEARAKAGSKKFSYYKVDLNRDDFGKGKYDLVVNLAALHHVENMDHVLKQIRQRLKPGGVFISFDYVGPFRNQYSDADLEKMNWMQSQFPERLVGREKIVRPDMEVMLKEDPSEAVGAELVVPGIKRYFRIARLRYLNGGLLYQVLYNQIQNFKQGNMEDDKLIKKGLKLEEEMTALGKANPLFVFIVAKLA